MALRELEKMLLCSVIVHTGGFSEEDFEELYRGPGLRFASPEILDMHVVCITKPTYCNDNYVYVYVEN